MFEHVDAYAGDPILSLVETFHQDPRAQKVNLGIGLGADGGAGGFALGADRFQEPLGAGI